MSYLYQFLETPIHFSAYDGHLECIKYLISNGANIDARTVVRDNVLNLQKS